MKIRDLMHTPIRSLAGQVTLRDAASLFRRERVLGAQICDGQGLPVGVFTQDELLQVLAGGAMMTDQVERHLRPVFCAVHPDTDVDELDWHGNRFFAVVEGDRVVGGLDAMTMMHIRYGTGYDEEMPAHEILQGLPEAVFLVDKDWKVRWNNSAAGLLCGSTAQGMHGLFLADALARAGFELEIDPEDNQSLHLAWRDDIRLLPIIWRTASAGNSPGRMVLLRNVQNQVQCNRELAGMRNLSRELHAIIESSFDGFYITDGEGRTLKVNRAYERITGIRAEEVLGKTMSELVTAGFYDESVTLRVLKSQRTETIIQKIKDTKTVVVTGNPVFDDDGKIWRVVTNVRDVTELRKLQLELERMARVQSQYRREIETLRRSMSPSPRIVLRSKKMQEILELIHRLAHVDSTVLIMGESGVGKEIVAQLLHNNSARRNHPFVKISCAAIPEQLLESELFGYAPGAFTGALRTGKSGLFETADKGTLFLDEIGEMPLGLQAKMLRILQDKSFTRLGDNRSATMDVRIVAATNRSLEEMVSRKQFRQDLFYRLNVVPIMVPPLRERREAIFDFIAQFLNRFNAKYGLSRQMETDALDLLVGMDWPGYVRELENAVERLVAMARGEVIGVDDVIRILSGKEEKVWAGADLKTVLRQTEEKIVLEALKQHRNTRAAAKALGVDQSTVVRKMQRLGIAPDDWRR